MYIRKANLEDIDSLVALSDQKRSDYEKVNPLFWKKAPDANRVQYLWFQEILNRQDHILLVAESQETLQGFIIGALIQAPAVYAPPGLTLMIDDFCVGAPDLWPSVGKTLLEAMTKESSQKGASQMVIVSGAHDTPKSTFLRSQNLSLTSEWHHKAIQG